jgi:hypothetical protein
MSRNDYDFYPTPPGAVRALGMWLEKKLGPRDHLGGRWLDPCVGAGAIPLWLSPYLSPEVRWDAMDIQEGMVATALQAGRVDHGEAVDALASRWLADPDDEPHTGIVMNPPYGSACERWIAKGIEEARLAVGDTHSPRPYLLALTRVGFWADGSRIRLFAPERLLWLEKRLSFTGDGKTDSTAHCWAVWNLAPRPPRPRGETVVETLRLPPVSDEDRASHQEMLGHARNRQPRLDFSALPN